MKFYYIYLTSILLLLNACNTPEMQCTHDIQLPISSPSGDKVAALDYVECGATVGKVSWVLIAPSDVKLTSEKSKFAVFEGRAESLLWQSENNLVITGQLSEFLVDETMGISITIRQ